MSELIQLLSHPHLEKILEQYQQNKQEKKKVAYNLFTLSSYNNERENFHSDVLLILLNPEGIHEEGDKFLKLFIRYLNEKHQAGIPPEKFSQARVAREEGRIDLKIVDGISKSAIIIENKMNDADDREEQLSRYHEKLKNDYTVFSIVYLTLDGIKQAPGFTKGINVLTRSIGAFTNQEDDLLNGWLIPCKEAAEREDNSSLIFQYIKLIKYLAQENMDSQTKQDFYKFISNEKGLTTAKQLQELFAGLAKYRRDILTQSIDDYRPFKKSKCMSYGGAEGICYENYRFEGLDLKLDIFFDQQGNIFVDLWVPSNRAGTEERGSLTKLVKGIGLENDLEVTDKGRSKHFQLNEHKDSLEKTDQAATALVKDLLERLRKFEKQKSNPL